MLKRINIQPINTYLQQTDSNPKNKNTYLQRMQKIKTNNVKNNYKETISRRGSTKSQAVQIYNWIKQDTDQSQTQPTYQDRASNTLDIQKYTKSKIKQKQWISSSCTMDNKKIQKQQRIHVIEQLQPAVVQTLNQFIEYCLQNGSQKQKIKQQLAIEMSNNPLSDIEKIVNQARGQLQVQINKKQIRQQQADTKQEQQQQQIQQIDRQNQQIQLQILMLINSHTQYRELLKNISNMQKQITITQQQTNIKYKNRQQQICTNINILQNNTQHINQQIMIYNNEIQAIINFKQKINRLQQQLQLNKKDSISYNKLHKQLKGQKALSTIKTELHKNYRTFQDGKLQLSNKQILQQFYENIRKKIMTIKNTINTNYEIHKFVADLEQQQNQNKQGIKITIQSNKLTKDQLLLYKNNQFQYKMYCEYFKNDSEINNIQSMIENIGKNHQVNLNKIKMEVENVKKQANEQINAIKQLETMEKIRQAQIMQLQQILKQKKQQINRLGILEVPESSRAGIKKSFIQNQNFKLGKNKY